MKHLICTPIDRTFKVHSSTRSTMSEELEEVLRFGERGVRVVGTYDDPWFCGNDVARALGYAQPRNAVLDHVQERDRRRLEDISVRVIPPRIEYHERESVYINRSGLYKLTFSSKLPIAEVFTDWVTSEIRRDVAKQRLCTEHGVTLIVVPYTVATKTIETYIRSHLGAVRLPSDIVPI
jgi:prophage antirepressor-like protein